MQSITLTRKELYELIWSKPITKVAKDFDVSDVWIGKLCRDADIPRPPVGYWQKVAAGKIPRKTPLPTAKLLARDIIYVKSTTHYGRSHRSDQSDEELVRAPEPSPPFFEETIEEFRDRIARSIKPISIPKDLKEIHAVTARLLREDKKRLKENAGDIWPWWRRQPLYQSKEGRKVLIALNCLFVRWSELGARPRVSNGRDLTISIEFSGSHVPLTFQAIPDGVKEVKSPSGGSPKYEFAWAYNSPQTDFRKSSSYRTYRDITGSLLRELIIDSVVIAEERVRGSAKWAYEFELRSKAEAADRIEQRRLAEIEQRRLEAEQLSASRIEKVDETLKLFDKAEKIRSLIAAFDKAYADGEGVTQAYLRWRQWAEEYANSLDPRGWSASDIESWAQDFRL